jgi:hypothetical protein
MQRGIKIPKVPIEGDVSTRMLEVDDIPVAKGGNFDAMYPTLCCCIDGLAFHSPKFVIQASMKVVGSKFREVASKVIPSPWLYG